MILVCLVISKDHVIEGSWVIDMRGRDLVY